MADEMTTSKNPGSNHRAIHKFSYEDTRGCNLLLVIFQHFTTSSRWYRMFIKRKPSKGLCRM